MPSVDPTLLLIVSVVLSFLIGLYFKNHRVRRLRRQLIQRNEWLNQVEAAAENAERFERSNALLEDRLAVAQGELEERERRLSRLEESGELGRLRDRVADLESEVESFRAEHGIDEVLEEKDQHLMEARAELREWQSKAKEAAGRVKEAEETEQAQADAIAAAAAEKDALRTDFEAKIKEIQTRLEAQEAGAEARLQEARDAEAGAGDAKLEALGARIEELEASLEEKSKEAAAAVESADQLRAELVALPVAPSSDDTARDTANERAEAEARIAALESAAAAAQAELAEARAQIESLESDLEAATEPGAAAGAAEVAELEAELADLRGRQNFQTELELELRAVEARLAGATGEAERALKERDAMAASIEASAADPTAIAEAVEAAKETWAAERDRDDKKKLANRKRTLDQKNKKLKSLEADNARLDKELETAREAISAFEQRLDGAGIEADPRVPILEERCKALEADLDARGKSERQAVGALEKKLARAEEWLEEAVAEKERLEAEVSRPADPADVAALRSQVVSLEEELRARTTEIGSARREGVETADRLRQQIDALMDDDRRHRARIEALEGQLDDAGDGGGSDNFEPTGVHDDLKRIPGISPMEEMVLNQIGVTSYRQLAAMTDRDIEQIARQVGTSPDRIRRSRWVEVAGRLDSENTTA